MLKLIFLTTLLSACFSAPLQNVCPQASDKISMSDLAKQAPIIVQAQVIGHQVTVMKTNSEGEPTLIVADTALTVEAVPKNTQVPCVPINFVLHDIILKDRCSDIHKTFQEGQSYFIMVRTRTNGLGGAEFAVDKQKNFFTVNSFNTKLIGNVTGCLNKNSCGSYICEDPINQNQFLIEQEQQIDNGQALANVEQSDVFEDEQPEPVVDENNLIFDDKDLPADEEIVTEEGELEEMLEEEAELEDMRKNEMESDDNLEEENDEMLDLQLDDENVEEENELEEMLEKEAELEDMRENEMEREDNLEEENDEDEMLDLPLDDEDVEEENELEEMLEEEAELEDMRENEMEREENLEEENDEDEMLDLPLDDEDVEEENELEEMLEEEAELEDMRENEMENEDNLEEENDEMLDLPLDDEDVEEENELEEMLEEETELKDMRENEMEREDNLEEENDEDEMLDLPLDDEDIEEENELEEMLEEETELEDMRENEMEKEDNLEEENDEDEMLDLPLDDEDIEEKNELEEMLEEETELEDMRENEMEREDNLEEENDEDEMLDLPLDDEDVEEKNELEEMLEEETELEDMMNEEESQNEDNLEEMKDQELFNGAVGDWQERNEDTRANFDTNDDMTQFDKEKLTDDWISMNKIEDETSEKILADEIEDGDDFGVGDGLVAFDDEKIKQDQIPNTDEVLNEGDVAILEEPIENAELLGDEKVDEMESEGENGGLWDPATEMVENRQGETTIDKEGNEKLDEPAQIKETQDGKSGVPVDYQDESKNIQVLRVALPAHLTLSVSDE
ncbi:probable serine/threonine-protein kinase kinX [Watersipora subatra]|uniref:probable serine/threonine-protein kinase kinX n=1 Tax=Watersipora subatra TaxID=2589382 RepID=UPI00355B51BA